MSSIPRPDTFVVLPRLSERTPAVSVPEFSHTMQAPVLNYHTSTGMAEEFAYKTLGGFAAGSLITGLMLNFAAVMGRRLFHSVPDAGLEFVMRGAMFFGLAFAGASLLLVAVKVREERSKTPLHSRHWLVSLGTGAIYTLVISAPGLAAESAFPVNRYAACAVWLAVLVLPILSSFWLLTARQPGDVVHA